jgi:hypothetical protein
MSKSVKFLALSISIFLGVVGYYSVPHLPMLKAQFAQSPKKYPRPPAFSKVGKPFNVDVFSAEDLSSDSSEPIKLIAKIQVLQVVDGLPLQVQWQLPDGINIMQGSPSQIKYDPKFGETLEFELLVSGLSTEVAQQIVVSAFYQQGEAPFGASAVFATQPHEVFVKTINEHGEAELASLTKGEVPLPDGVKR